MGGEDSVQIPVGVYVDKNSLDKLKSDVERTFKNIEDYEKGRSSKRNKYTIPGMENKNKAMVDGLIESVERLNKEYSKLSTGKATDEISQRIAMQRKAVGEAIKGVAEAQKDLNKSFSEVGNNYKKLNKSLNEVEATQAKLDKLQKDFNKRVEDDPKDKGHNKRIKQMAAEYNAEKQLLEEELRDRKSLANINKIIANKVSEDYNSNKDALQSSQESLVSARAELAESEKLLHNEQYLNEAEAERLSRMQEITAQLDEQIKKIAQITQASSDAMKEDKEETGYKTLEEKNAERQAREAAKAKRDAINESVAATKKEISAVKESAAQYYYRLRALKMFGFAITNVSRSLDTFNKKAVSGAKNALNAYLRLIPGVRALEKSLSNVSSSQKQFNRDVIKSTKSHGAFNMSLKQAVTSLLKYTIGIRSLFVLFNRLRSAMIEGFKSMAVQFNDVNRQVSSIISSLNQMKASIAAAAQPVLTALAPAFERLAAIVADVAYKVASFIALLTGQSFVYKATRVQTDYAASLDKTAKSAKNARKELAGFDELNVLHSDDDSGGGGKDNTGGMGFEKVPIDSTIADWYKKLKDFFNRLLAPIKKAWNKVKSYVISSFKYMIKQLGLLWKAFAEDFWKVWEEDKTQRIFEDIFLIIGDIFMIVGKLAERLREAWEYNDNGYRILKAIRDGIFEVVHNIREATRYTVEWLDNSLTLVPLISSIADVLNSSVVPAIRAVMKMLVYLYENVILPIAENIIERILPLLIYAFGDIMDALTIITTKVRGVLEDADRGESIVNSFLGILYIIAKAIRDCTKETKKWAKSLDFRPLTDSFSDFLKDVQPLIQAVSDTLSHLYYDTLLPFYQYLIEKGFPKLLDTLSDIVKSIDWNKFNQNMTNFMKALEPVLELIWEVGVQIIEDLGTTIADFINSGALESLIDGFKEWSEWFSSLSEEDRAAYIDGIATSIERLTGAMIGVTGAFKLADKVIFPFFINLMTIANFFKQNAMVKTVKDLSQTLTTLTGGEVAKKGIAVGPFKKLSGVLSDIAKSLGDIVKQAPKASSKIKDFAKGFNGSSGLAGGLTTVVGAITALVGGLDMMNNGFSVAGESVTVFGSILTGIGLFIAGVAAWPATIASGITLAVANLGAFGDDIWNTIVGGFGDAVNAVREKFLELGYNAGVWVGEVASSIAKFIRDFDMGEFIDTVHTKVGEIIDSIGPFIEEKWEQLKEFGMNILKGILAIFTSPLELLALIGDAIASFFEGFVQGLKDGFDMGSPSKKMEPYGKWILEGILNGIVEGIKDIGKWINTNILEPMKKGFNNAFQIVEGKARAFLEYGRSVIEGIIEGIKEKVTELLFKVVTVARDVKDKFKSMLSVTALVETGKNLIQGLKDGIMAGAVKLNDDINSIGAGIIKTVNDTFETHSPSKVFEEIGGYLMEGMSIGIEDESKATVKSMNSAVNDVLNASDISNNLGNTFISSLSKMSHTAVDVVTDMCSDIQDKFNAISLAGNMQTEIRKIERLGLPGIASGRVVPSMSMSNSTAISDAISKIPGMLRSTMSDMLGDLSYNNRDTNDIVIQIDGYEVFRAVRNQSEQFRYSTGYSAL